eukprot:NODE_313_length_11219_cov_0.287770.p1 type:complete len:682 gc:universal NODE_313_length_11219_cov_0.287770:3224-5269(+)
MTEMIAANSPNVKLTVFASKHGVHVTDLKNQMILPHQATHVALSCFDSHVYLLVQTDVLYLYKWHESMVFLEKLEPLQYDVQYKNIQLHNDLCVFQLENDQVHSIGVEDLEGMSEHIFTTKNSFIFVKPNCYMEYSKKDLIYHSNGCKFAKSIPFTITAVTIENDICAVGTKGGQVLIFYLNATLNSYEMYHWHPTAVTGLAILNQTVCSIGKEAVVVYYHLVEKSKDFISRVHRGAINKMVKCHNSLVIQARDGAVYAVIENDKATRLYKDIILIDPGYSAVIEQLNDLIYLNATPGIIQIINSDCKVVDEIDYAPEYSYVPSIGKKIQPTVPKLSRFLVLDSIMICIVNHMLLRVYKKVNGSYQYISLRKSSSPIKCIQEVNNMIYVLKSNQLEVYSLDFEILNIIRVPFDFCAAEFSVDGSMMLASCGNNLVFFSIQQQVILMETQLRDACTSLYRVRNCVYCLGGTSLVVVDLLAGNVVSQCKIPNDATLFQNYLFCDTAYKINVHEIVECKRRGLDCDLQPFEEIKVLPKTIKMYLLDSKAVYWTNDGLKAEESLKDMVINVDRTENRALGSIYDLSKKSITAIQRVLACDSFVKPLQELFELPNEHMYLIEDDLCTLLEAQMHVEDGEVEEEDKEDNTIKDTNSPDANISVQFHSNEFKKPPKYLRQYAKSIEAK